MTTETTATVPQPAELITLSGLQQRFPPYIDREIADIGTFRFHRLHAVQVMEYQSIISGMSDDEGSAPKDELIKASMEFVSKSLGGEYQTAEGFNTLWSLPFGIQTEMIGAAMEASKASSIKRVEEIQEAKNE